MLYRAYQTAADDHFLPRCQGIYLTLEIFSGTAERPADILANIREAFAYGRKFIPEDGLTLDQLVTQ